MPTQTFRYYPGYPYIKYLPKNSIIATSPNLCFCNSHCHTILWYTTLACPRANIFHQLSYSTHHSKSYPTDPTYIYASILPTIRIQPTSDTKIPNEIYAYVGDEFGFNFSVIFFCQCGTIFYLVLYSVWCSAVHVVTPILSIDL